MGTVHHDASSSPVDIDTDIESAISSSPRHRLDSSASSSEGSLYEKTALASSPWNNDPFLMALQSGFDDSGQVLNYEYVNSSERIKRHSRGKSGLVLEKVLEEEILHDECRQQENVIERGQVENDIERGQENGYMERNAENNASKSGEKESSAFTINKTALHFGIRISFVLTVSSLFVLVQSPDGDSLSYPQGVWVYISALMVSWFPSMAAASVAEKTFERIMGTCIGACLGCGCGFLSLSMPNFQAQALFMAFCIAIVTFAYSYATIQFKTSFVGRYSYASLLCLLTFGIALLPFYTDEDPKYKKGVFRVINVIVGCAIGALGSLLLWPRSTKRLLRDKIQNQVMLAGEASEAVLQFASETFKRRAEKVDSSPRVITAAVLSLRRSVGKDENDCEDIDMVNEAAHEKYNQAIGEWKEVSSVFKLAKYDPFNLCRDMESYSAYRKEVALTLARALRIQTTVVLLDGIVRNDRGGRFSRRQLDLFDEIGRLIKTMLTPPYNEENSEAAAEDLLDHLDEIRTCIIEESQQVAAAASMHRRLFCGSVGKEEYKAMLAMQDRGMPLCVHSRDKCSLLFLQLVEHLVMRSLRLYFIWRKVEK